jgi:hypothetical protein
MNIPKNVNNSNWLCEFNKQEVDDFILQIPIIQENIQGKSLYFHDKKISQSKCRDTGFIIKRDSDKCDVVVINDIRNLAWKRYDTDNYKYNGYKKQEIENWFSEINEFVSKNYKFIFSKDLYKYLYKYEGNLELFKQCDELFRSNDRTNYQLAMEFISNANWEENEIYLRELFNLFSNNIKRCNYYTSISFKGFISSLNYKIDDKIFYPKDYKKFCNNDEHHQFVFDKYRKEFKEELDDLINTYKIQIDKLEYSIDKSIYNESRK